MQEREREREMLVASKFSIIYYILKLDVKFLLIFLPISRGKLIILRAAPLSLPLPQPPPPTPSATTPRAKKCFAMRNQDSCGTKTLSCVGTIAFERWKFDRKGRKQMMFPKQISLSLSPHLSVASRFPHFLRWSGLVGWVGRHLPGTISHGKKRERQGQNEVQ